MPAQVIYSALVINIHYHKLEFLNFFKTILELKILAELFSKQWELTSWTQEYNALHANIQHVNCSTLHWLHVDLSEQHYRSTSCHTSALEQRNKCTHLRIEVIINDLRPTHFRPISVDKLKEKHARVALREIVQILEILTGYRDFYLWKCIPWSKRWRMLCSHALHFLCSAQCAIWHLKPMRNAINTPSVMGIN